MAQAAPSFALNRGPNFFRMKAENRVACQHVRGAQNSFAARGIGHGQSRDLQIVAQPRIGFLGFGIDEPGENATDERRDAQWHPALLVSAVSRGA